eukprot:CAMPEP_0182421980 /NCGR_PEP_ID=MMETSP1167-20130531/7572_1 /TAXON_ID=2988 /ORGANISM="Mallomonas Sp, Strain CCMP3275" /LENGTH=252 /DNA_ID=CAMNT_0024599663 /DNA_START=405 /DNA_END=1163 /DNA_ORIENTATION=-
MMHGLGDSAEGFADFGEVLGQNFPHLKIILPSALSRSVTLNGGALMPAWYDITNFIDNSADGIEDSASIICSILEKENTLGIPYHRMALAGFSQGGAMSLFVGLQLPIDMKLAGLLVLSGYLPAIERFSLTEGLGDMRVLHCHGTTDPVVSFDKAMATKTTMVLKGLCDYRLQSFPGMPHTVTHEVMSASVAFLSEILPHDQSYALQPKSASDMSVKELKAALRAANLIHKAKGFTEKSEFINLLEEYRASL